MDVDLIRDHLSHTIKRTQFRGLGERYEGKVRDTYREGDRLTLITTDRISSFDHVLPQTIPFKGQVLNQVAAYFFEHTQDVAPNHVVEIPDPNVTRAVACTPIPIEFVIRGYLAGQAWRLYDGGQRTISGVELPEGLKQNSPLPEPILTPATKAESGHDENIARDEAIRRGLVDEEVFDICNRYARDLFDRGTEMAASRGLILVDTKYEFGLTPENVVVVIDEIHTPDCSRYFYADGFEARLRDDRSQRQLSKEFVRDWLREQGFTGKAGQKMPDVPPELRIRVTERYVELYEQLTETPFEPDLHPDPVRRIEETLQLQS